MSALDLKPDPKLPPETPCVECGERKDAHRHGAHGPNTWLCWPLVHVPRTTPQDPAWRQFR